MSFNALRASNPIAPTNAFQNAQLADFAAHYRNDKFIADVIAPPILVDLLSGTFKKRVRKDVETPLDNFVGARGAIPEATYETTDGSFQCIGYGLKNPVPLQLQSSVDGPIQPKEWATQNVQQRNMLAREIRIADLVMTASNWATSNTSAAGNLWSDPTNGEPLTDIHTMLEAIPDGGEDSLLVGVCSKKVFHAMRRHPQIRDMHGLGQGQLTKEVLAGYCELDMLHVSGVFKNTANTGQARVSSRVWDDTKFAIVKVPRQLVSTEQETFCATFRHRMIGAANGWLAREWHVADEGTQGTDYVAVTHEDDEIVVQDDQGYLLESVLS